VKEDGQYKLLASADSLENVGKVVLELLKANDLDAAARWLDLAVSGTYRKKGESKGTVTVNVLKSGPTGDDSPAAKFLWNDLGEKERTAAAMRIAAASLMGTFSRSEEAIRILKQEREKAANRLERGNIDLALCQAYAKAEKWTELWTSAQDLKASFAVKDKSFGFRVKARTGMKQWAELEQEAQAELKASPESPVALRAAALAAMRGGHPEKASGYIASLEKNPVSGKAEHTMAAWHALISGKADDKLMEKLERDASGNDMEPDMHYLLGLMQAQAGKADDAYRALTSALEMEDWSLMDARPWVLQGMIQEKLGNAEASAPAYAEARKRVAGGEDSAWLAMLIPAEGKK